MKMSIFAAVLFLSTISFAFSGKLPPSDDGSGAEQCAYYDSGSTEEHGLHRTMEECRSAHGNCQMRCYVYEYTCHVEGVTIDFVKLPDGKIDRVENTSSFLGTHRDEYRAREIAYRNCESSYPRHDFCRMTSCSKDAARTR